MVLAAVLVVPMAQPLGASLEGAAAAACEVLDAGRARVQGGAFDTRLVRVRSFAEGVLQLLDGEPFDLLVLERRRDQLRNGAGAQTQALTRESADHDRPDQAPRLSARR